MATWEEMINGTYNPVNAVNERHQQLLNQRQAANLQRMQAANPGFQAGGYGMPAQYPMNDPRIPNDPRQPLQMPVNQQFQQFGPPSIAANQDEWLKSQFDLAGEHLGGIGDPEAAAAVAAQAGGPIGGGQGGASDGPNNTGDGRTFGGVPFGSLDQETQDAINNAQGLSPSMATALSLAFGPAFSPMINANTMSDDTMEALGELDKMIRDGVIPDNTILNNNLFDDAPGVGLGNTIGLDGTAAGDDAGAPVGSDSPFGEGQQQADNPSGFADPGGSTGTGGTATGAGASGDQGRDGGYGGGGDSGGSDGGDSGGRGGDGPNSEK